MQQYGGLGVLSGREDSGFPVGPLQLEQVSLLIMVYPEFCKPRKGHELLMNAIRFPF